MQSPDSEIIDNVTAPYSKGGGHFVLRESPRAWIIGNRAPDGGAGLFLDRSDDSQIEATYLARNATIQLLNSDHCRIVRNTLIRGPAPQPNYGGSVYLTGSSDNLLSENRVEGSLGIFLTGGTLLTASNTVIYRGANRNLIEDNLISDSGLGLTLFGASENRILRNRIERTQLGLGIYGLIDPDSTFDLPSDRNLVESNVVAGGLYGVETWRASGNLFQDNEITDQWIGLWEGPVGPFSPAVNEYRGNSVIGVRISDSSSSAALPF